MHWLQGSPKSMHSNKHPKTYQNLAYIYITVTFTIYKLKTFHKFKTLSQNRILD